MAIEEEPPAGVPDWIVSFGDMMSLLLCFFVLLFSMGQTEQEKFQAMADSMQHQFGQTNPRLKIYPRDHPPLMKRKERLCTDEFDRGQTIQTSTEQEAQQGSDKQRLWVTRPGPSPTAGVVLLFDAGASELNENHRRKLHEAAEMFAGKANRIEIRGHATGRPPEAGDTYRDEWELAFQRCYRTMQQLVDQEGIDRRRIRLGLAGKNEPLYRGVEPESLRMNSRVEVYMLNEIVE